MPIRTSLRVADTGTGLLDTSVIIDLDVVVPADLLEEASVSAVTMAELSAGPHATDDRAESARRRYRCRPPTPAARCRPIHRGDCAGSAVLPLYTRNPNDFRGLEDIVHIISI